jgi:hypothetical protein
MQGMLLYEPIRTRSNNILSQKSEPYRSKISHRLDILKLILLVFSPLKTIYCMKLNETKLHSHHPMCRNDVPLQLSA